MKYRYWYISKCVYPEIIAFHSVGIKKNNVLLAALLPCFYVESVNKNKSIMKNSVQCVVLMSLLMLGCTQEKGKEEMKEPIAKKVPHEITWHNHARLDNYFWMRLSDEQKEAKEKDQQTKDVLTYLDAENEYRMHHMRHTEPFQKDLFEEIVGRIEQKDESVPVVKNGYSYIVRYEEGEDYPLHCRTSIAEENAKEEILLNGPEMAKGLDYFAIGGKSVSPNNKRMIYGLDTVSRRQYTLYIKDLETGALLTDVIPNTTGGAVWANDNETVFYTRKDPVTLRSYRIYKHKIGENPENDELVFEEKDETFSCYVTKSKSEDFIFIGSFQTLSSEYRFIDANDPNGEWKVIQPRERNLEYSVEHFGDNFYILNNWNAENFQLMKTPIDQSTKENWEPVIAHRPEVFLEDMEIFKDFLVLQERNNGLTAIRIMPWRNGEEHYISFDDPTYMAYVTSNPEFNTSTLRFVYSSLTTPTTEYDYNMEDKSKKLLKQTKVLDPNFSPDNYTSERLYAPAEDGTLVPISIVYKKGMEKNGRNPLLLYGYGSYGNSIDPYFSSVRLSLLDRGFAFAIAHIRGGQEMGRQWYEDGKLLKKKNTFTDFIACGEFLVEQNYTNTSHLYAQGGSAGGLLVGAVINMRSDLFNGVIAAVPFVDVVSTMLDESIPLTTGEFDEWGNPKDEEYYHYMLSYSPYDNVTEQDYPHLLITTGYWDSQVQYWEPAKWIAKIRDLRTNDNQLYMYCNMQVGHGGASGRFERYKEVAMEYAFLLDLEDLTK